MMRLPPTNERDCRITKETVLIGTVSWYFPVHNLSRFNNQLDCSSFFAIDQNVGKRGYANKINAAWRNEAPSYSNCFNRLIQSSRSDRLNFSPPFFPQDACQSSCY